MSYRSKPSPESDQRLRNRVAFLRRADVVRCTAGKWFVCEFRKRDGTTRRMLARTGVHKNITNKGMKYDPSDFALIVVWDAKVRDYRMINLNTLQWLKCGDYLWERRLGAADFRHERAVPGFESSTDDESLDDFTRAKENTHGY